MPSPSLSNWAFYDAQSTKNMHGCMDHRLYWMVLIRCNQNLNKVQPFNVKYTWKCMYIWRRLILENSASGGQKRFFTGMIVWAWQERGKHSVDSISPHIILGMSPQGHYQSFFFWDPYPYQQYGQCVWTDLWEI